MAQHGLCMDMTSAHACRIWWQMLLVSKVLALVPLKRLEFHGQNFTTVTCSNGVPCLLLTWFSTVPNDF